MTERAANPLAPPIPSDASVRRIGWSHLHGSARALAIAVAAQRHKGPSLVIAASNQAAAEMELHLRFFAPKLRCEVLPDWETLPYDQFSPYQDIISTRVRTLAELPDWNQGILIAAIPSLSLRLAPPEWLRGQHYTLAAGGRLDREAFRERLDQAGYRCVGEVAEHGDFAIRGSLLDLFPMGMERPIRIDLLDDEIDSLRLFDVETQRTLETLARFELLPAREFPLTESSIALFRQNWRQRFAGRLADMPVYQDVTAGLAPAGIEYYLPLFFDRTVSLFDYLPEKTLVFRDEGCEAALRAFLVEAAERYEQYRHDAQRPILPPGEIYLAAEELIEREAAFATIELGRANLPVSHEFDSLPPVALPVDVRAEQPLAQLQRYLAAFPGRVLLAAESPGRRETLLDLLRRHDLYPTTYDDWQAFLHDRKPLGIAIAPLQQGLELNEPKLAVVTEAQLFGQRAAQSRRRRRAVTDPDAIIRNLTELGVGAPVVHERHGVGRYHGLTTLTVGGIANEFIELRYADGDKLFVPVASLHLLNRFSGLDAEHAPLHKLGSGQWDKAKRKAAERIRDVAAELLEIYARREARPGHAFKFDRDAYQTFAQQFPFEETPDQEAAIGAVLRDLAAPKPMDRLICGDVGFGKTEVALRAAFVAVQGGKQVAVLVPTTLLAQQHFQTFRDRFADWPVRVEQLSRFVATGDSKGVVAGLQDGRVDIVIGTHKLLSEQLKFKRLGLLVIDEEHRFGVRQKERIKALRAEVDILTLTATPIPRTLNMALSGTRELSVIATPPARRLAIKTFVRQRSNSLIREAILREIGRGGQVYFVHNRVEDIEVVAREVGHIVPEARIALAHGQMPERTLEQVMLDFYHQRSNVLVCTTIIETGIDVPTANTMLIDRADRFGLAQLYQLRGRIGRSHHRAYAYLLVPEQRAMTADAVKRLEAIEALEDLGIGFTLATHDLEIRGAGEILGEEQSGHIQEIGFGLYSEMLQRAVAALRAGREPPSDLADRDAAEIELHLPALLPEDYLPDVASRLTQYKRIASALDDAALDLLREEMIDRFGPLPAPAKNLFQVASLRLRCQQLGVQKVDLGREGGSIVVAPDARIDPLVVVKLVQSQPDRIRFDGAQKLRIRTSMPEAADRLRETEKLLDLLGGRRAA